MKLPKFHLSFYLGGAIVLCLLVIAIFAPIIAPYNPFEDFRGLENLSPSFENHNGHVFLLGTDQLGRDLLSRLIFGTRYCLFMGCLSVLFAACIGIPLGLYAGYIKSADRIISKATDILMSFPAILIAIIVVSILGPGLYNAIIAVGLTSIPAFIRLTRGQVLAESRKEYVMAAQSIGVRTNRILFQHIFRNIVSPLLVLTSLSLGAAILESASLSFLNLGVSPPAPEWGSMIRSGMETFLSTNPWVSTFSGFCIFLNVLGFNLLGDALRDKWDPMLRGK
ncbi:MAG: ABC transporter permease [Deltaproteobacteria bacterium]|nr:ABC transporter permease [Deltaproteobacteria bacterium]